LKPLFDLASETTKSSLGDLTDIFFGGGEDKAASLPDKLQQSNDKKKK